ncbi:MAG: hypothetical protein EXQ97_03830 [Alphaproteobacteria bacterium]|nr:hypothetical protein [Alphaproteobacteria bacterium]
MRGENFDQRQIGVNAHAAAQAHNSYLELALEGGLPSAIALHAALAWLIAFTIGGVARRRVDGFVPVVTLADSVLLAVHALVDFSLQIPAIAATWAILLGIGCPQSLSSRVRDGERDERPNGQRSRQDRIWP